MPRTTIPLRAVIAAQHTALVASRELIRECVFLPGADSGRLLAVLQEIDAAIAAVSNVRAAAPRPESQP